MDKNNKSVFIVSEWLPKQGYEQDVFEIFQELASLVLRKEKGCLQYHVRRQIPHPGSPGVSRYKIMLIQEYENIEAFDIHCAAPYVADYFEKYVNKPKTATIEEWRCRLFSTENF